LVSPSYENSVKYPPRSFVVYGVRRPRRLSPKKRECSNLRKMATAEDAADRRCLVLSDCKPALEGICRYRAQLESVTFLWVPRQPRGVR